MIIVEELFLISSAIINYFSFPKDSGQKLWFLYTVFQKEHDNLLTCIQYSIIICMKIIKPK